MRLVSPLLKRVIYPGLSRAGYLRRRRATGPVALTYHGILPPSYHGIDRALDANLVSVSAFRQQLRFLKAHYNVISPPEFLAWCDGDHGLPDKSVLLTCDDGLRSCIDYMLPSLLEEELSCLFFITGASLWHHPAMLWHERLYLALASTRIPFRIVLDDLQLRFSAHSRRALSTTYRQILLHLSQFPEAERRAIVRDCEFQLKFHHEDTLSHPEARSRFLVMNPSELVKLRRAGMELGAHTTSHPVLSRMPEKLAAGEIQDNRAALEGLTGQRTWALAYPFGTPASAGPREYRMAAAAGFSCAFTNCEGAGADKFALPRIHVTRDMSMPEFEAHVSGIHHSLQNLAVRRTGASCN